MGDFPTAEEQQAAEDQKQRELAQARVERREQLGQTPQPEPALDGPSEEE